MIDGVFMSREVEAAVLGLLPVLLVAYAAAQSGQMNGWKLHKLKPKRRREARRVALLFIGIMLFAIPVELQFLFALNDGDAIGWPALGLWMSAISWLFALSLAVATSGIPDSLSRRSAT